MLFDFGLGREDVEILREMLDDATNNSGYYAHRKQNYSLASPLPLLLFDCAFADSVVHFTETEEES